MIIVFMVLSILIIVASCIGGAFADYYNNEGWLWGIAIGVIILIINIFLMFIFINDVKELDIIDDKIEMYQKENTKIENQIDTLIKQYLAHESNTLIEFKSESSITLVNLYPELKSNELVQQQLKIYVENNNKIKELKEGKLEKKLSKWWLYFGKVD